MRDTPALMTCGHTANAQHVLPDGSTEPSCVICDCVTPARPARSTGRTARCGCGRTSPSTYGLPFFEYRGPGSLASIRTCECGYYEQAHPRPTCETFAPRGAFEFDSYYCGHAGWD